MADSRKRAGPYIHDEPIGVSKSKKVLPSPLKKKEKPHNGGGMQKGHRNQLQELSLTKAGKKKIEQENIVLDITQILNQYL